MSYNSEILRNVLRDSIDSTPERVARFFKTGALEYAAHDQFMGIRVPTLRNIAKQYTSMALKELTCFMRSPINEERLLALLILIHQYQNATPQDTEVLYQFYLSHIKYVNNWNLVDSSAHYIIGAHLWDKDRRLLEILAVSDSMWERRIAIVATWYFIRKSDLESTFKIAKLLLNDSHDLIHNAVGWMLREAGKQDHTKLVHFVSQHVHTIPRVMLRYAIEKFPEEQRKQYMLRKKS